MADGKPTKAYDTVNRSLLLTIYTDNYGKTTMDQHWKTENQQL